jgi:hypothetical protein
MPSLFVSSTLAFALALAACQPPEQPPVAPPALLDPTVERAALALQPTAVIDASILAEGGRIIDATVFELDAGASAR